MRRASVGPGALRRRRAPGKTSQAYRRPRSSSKTLCLAASISRNWPERRPHQRKASQAKTSAIMSATTARLSTDITASPQRQEVRRQRVQVRLRQVGEGGHDRAESDRLRVPEVGEGPLPAEGEFVGTAECFRGWVGPAPGGGRGREPAREAGRDDDAHHEEQQRAAEE